MSDFTMASTFWGLRLEPGKRYSTTVDKSFHVSMAALDCTSVKSDNEILSVMIEDDKSNFPFILCNLQKNKLIQSPLDLSFMSGDRITIFCKGSGVVHLTGYLILEGYDELVNGSEDDEDDEDEEGEEAEEGSDDEELLKGKFKLNGIQGKRKLNDLKEPKSKKKKIKSAEEESDDEDDDDMSGSDDIEDENMGLEGEESDDEDDDDDDDEDDDDDDDDEEEEDSDKPLPSKSTKLSKKDKNNKNQSQKETNKPLQVAKNKQPNKGQQKINGLSPESQAGKDKKKVEKVTGGNKAKETSESNKNDGPRKLNGGVVVKDIKVGNGPVCKPGKMASVYYTGRFKQNNKVFDSATDGSGFKFRVGKGEVIKGWDVGVVGMKVGGKRLITCPPQMAYGPKGSPPTIPANSTLVFEVELKSMN